MKIFFLTLILSLRTVMVCQLSVAKAMASRATDTRLKMEAKANVSALQKPILFPYAIYCTRPLAAAQAHNPTTGGCWSEGTPMHQQHERFTDVAPGGWYEGERRGGVVARGGDRFSGDANAGSDLPLAGR